MSIPDHLLQEIAWKSYRLCHTPEGRERLTRDHGERWFIERGIQFHTGILRNAVTVLEELGYEIVANPNTPTLGEIEEKDFSDLC